MVCAHNPVRTGSNLCDGFAEQLAFNLAENGLQQFPVLIKRDTMFRSRAESRRHH